mgnify:FL=1
MNELKLEFQLETTEIPAELDKVLVSFLKATIENYSPALFEKLYNKNSSILKKYTWDNMPAWGKIYTGKNIT